MKTLHIQTIKSLILSVIIILGVSYVYAWSTNQAAPTDANTQPPIDVGTTTQNKAGSLNLLQNLTVAGDVTLDLSITGGELIILDGNEGGGKVLTSDANGNVYWK